MPIGMRLAEERKSKVKTVKGIKPKDHRSTLEQLQAHFPLFRFLDIGSVNPDHYEATSNATVQRNSESIFYYIESAPKNQALRNKLSMVCSCGVDPESPFILFHQTGVYAFTKNESVGPRTRRKIREWVSDLHTINDRSMPRYCSKHAREHASMNASDHDVKQAGAPRVAEIVNEPELTDDENSDVKTIMSQTQSLGITRAQAIAALKQHGNMVDAIIALLP